MASKGGAARTATRNERTSATVASIAGKVLASGKATPAQAKVLAASALTQTVPKSSGKKK